RIKWRRCAPPACKSRRRMRTPRCSRLPSSAELRDHDQAGEAVPPGAVPHAIELNEQLRPVGVVAEERLQTGVQHLVSLAGGGGRQMRGADGAGARKARLEPPPQAARLCLAAELAERDEHAAQ